MVDWKVWAALGAVAISLAVCVVAVMRQLNRNAGDWDRQRTTEREEREEARRRLEQLHGANMALQTQITALIASNAEMAVANAQLKSQLSEEIDSLAKLRQSVHDQRNETNARETLRDVEKIELKVKLEETSKKLDDAMAKIAAFTCKAEDRADQAEQRADERAENAEARADERADAAGTQPHAPEGR